MFYYLNTIVMSCKNKIVFIIGGKYNNIIFTANEHDSIFILLYYERQSQ